MKTILHVAAILSLVVCGATAQAPATEEAQAPTAAEMQKSLAIVKQRLALQEQSLSKIETKMLDLDQGIESRIDQLLQQLESVKDEQGTRLANLKNDVMVSLKKTMDLYKRERDKRMAELDKTYSGLSKEELQKDVVRLNEKMEKRVDQIVSMAETLTRDQGFQKYDTYITDNSVINIKTDEYKQNKRESSKTSQSTEKIVNGLRQSIESLKRVNTKLEKDLARAKNDNDKAFYQDQIRFNNELMDSRRAQIQSLINASGGAENALSKQESFQMEQLINEMMMGLKTDFNELYRLSTERYNARIRLRNLTAQKGQLEAELKPAQ